MSEVDPSPEWWFDLAHYMTAYPFRIHDRSLAISTSARFEEGDPIVSAARQTIGWEDDARDRLVALAREVFDAVEVTEIAAKRFRLLHLLGFLKVVHKGVDVRLEMAVDDIGDIFTMIRDDRVPWN